MVDRKIHSEYSLLDYIEFKPEQTIDVGGFKTEDEAKTRIEELKKINPMIEDRIFAKQEFIITDYAIKIPKTMEKYLSNAEKNRILKENQCVQFISNQPIVYRDIGEKYIDNFMETGELLVSTFKRCQNLENYKRKDERELRNIINSIDGKYRVEVDMQLNVNAFLLCTSLNSHFVESNSKYCLEIKDINACLSIITNSLISKGYKVKKVLFGPCFYSNKELSGRVEQNRIKKMIEEQNKTQTINIGKVLSDSGIVGGYDIFFNKDLHFSHENEYRIIWLVNDDFKEDKIIIKVPELREYCCKTKI